MTKHIVKEADEEVCDSGRSFVADNRLDDKLDQDQPGGRAKDSEKQAPHCAGFHILQRLLIERSQQTRLRRCHAQGTITFVGDKLRMK